MYQIPDPEYKAPDDPLGKSPDPDTLKGIVDSLVLNDPEKFITDGYIDIDRVWEATLAHAEEKNLVNDHGNLMATIFDNHIEDAWWRGLEAEARRDAVLCKLLRGAQRGWPRCP